MFSTEPVLLKPVRRTHTFFFKWSAHEHKKQKLSPRQMLWNSAAPGQYIFVPLTMWHIRKNDGCHITGADGGSCPQGASEWAKPIYCRKSVKQHTEIKHGISSVEISSSFQLPALSRCSTSLCLTQINSKKRNLHGIIPRFNGKVF